MSVFYLIQKGYTTSCMQVATNNYSQYALLRIAMLADFFKLQRLLRRRSLCNQMQPQVKFNGLNSFCRSRVEINLICIEFIW